MNTLTRLFLYYIPKILKGKRVASNIYLKLYINTVNKELKKTTATQEQHTDKVWTMWLQDDIPEIIQVCLNSIKKFYPNVIIITHNNLENYIKLPAYIKEKFNKKQISAPHYSDYIRCALLEKYGGIWLDASLLMLDKIPTFITNQDFFILTNPTQTEISNFFIYSKPNNYLIKTMRIFLEKYWEKENFAVNYFFFHIFFMLICQKNPEFKRQFKKMKHWTNSQIRYFVDHTNIDYNADLWEYLTQTSFMYKLNRKDILSMKNPNGFYQHILAQQCL